MLKDHIKMRPRTKYINLTGNNTKYFLLLGLRRFKKKTRATPNDLKENIFVKIAWTVIWRTILEKNMSNSFTWKPFTSDPA